MSWWSRLLGGRSAPQSPEGTHAIPMTMPGWSEEASRDNLRVWRDSDGAVLSFASLKSLGLPGMPNENSLQAYARELAKGRNGGLIEVRSGFGKPGAFSLIYKRLQSQSYTFTGMLLVPGQPCSQVWTIVDGEHGTTGVREAIVTAELLNAGTLTMQEYESSWAQDPYDAQYDGVDRSVLHFMSDDECYDARFPEHPLSKVRLVLAALPDYVAEFSSAPCK